MNIHDGFWGSKTNINPSTILSCMKRIFSNTQINFINIYRCFFLNQFLKRIISTDISVFILHQSTVDIFNWNFLQNSPCQVLRPLFFAADTLPQMLRSKAPALLLAGHLWQQRLGESLKPRPISGSLGQLTITLW